MLMTGNNMNSPNIRTDMTRDIFKAKILSKEFKDLEIYRAI